MVVLSMEILAEEIEKIARTAVRKYGVSFEDHVQDLWEWMVIKQPEHLGTARGQLVNRSIDLCRKKSRVYGGLENTDFDDPCGENFAREESSLSSAYRVQDTRGVEDTAIVKSMIDSLQVGSRERIFVVCKLYLIEGFEFLGSEFRTYFDELSDNDKEKVLSAKNYTDDLISKVFLKIKTGTNSGSMRVLKQSLSKWIAAFQY